MKTLVIGYGNDSRNDDGAGGAVIAALTPLALPDVTLETAHQLEVDLAETVCDCDQVIFVDAAVPELPASWRREEVTPGFTSHAVAHVLTPGDVLGLCQILYGRAPRGVLFSIRGHDFNFGTTVSPDVQRAATAVAGEISRLLHSESLGGTPSPASVSGSRTDAGDGVPPNGAEPSSGRLVTLPSEPL